MSRMNRLPATISRKVLYGVPAMDAFALEAA